MKTVFIMDMPESCEKCPLLRYDVVSHIGCAATSNIVLRKVGEEKPKWCPLRLLPEKEQICLEGDEWSEGIMQGWNDTIRAIEGSGEDG